MPLEIKNHLPPLIRGQIYKKMYYVFREKKNFEFG